MKHDFRAAFHFYATGITPAMAFKAAVGLSHLPETLAAWVISAAVSSSCWFSVFSAGAVS